jgi:hypothetical protein
MQAWQGLIGHAGLVGRGHAGLAVINRTCRPGRKGRHAGLAVINRTCRPGREGTCRPGPPAPRRPRCGDL